MEATMNHPFSTDNEKLSLITRDLNAEYPRGPNEKLADYVFAARTLDKCRSYLSGTIGDYEFNCRMDRRFFDFAGINVIEFIELVASGADDEAVSSWITANALLRDRTEVVAWNNRMRELRISDLPPASQVYLEDYIPESVPSGRAVITVFDLFDAEEGRL